MSNTQIFDIFNESVFCSNVEEFDDEDGRYEIRTYNGRFLFTLGISTRLDGPVSENALASLNRSQFPFKYTVSDNALQCLAALWIDRKPSKKALSELIAVATCNLKNAKQVVLHYEEDDR